ncbi:MAG: right-handed parallel beta-helix repeat-containing protein, partial [bacterium]
VPRNTEHPLSGAYSGTTLRLYGSSFYPLSTSNDDIVYFGATPVPMEARTNTEIEIAVPQLPPGTYNIYIKSPENNNLETDRFLFEVFAPPTLRGVVPESAKLGDRVRLRGDHFGYFGYQDNPLRIQIGDLIIQPIFVNSSYLEFRMPSIGDPGETSPISVWTPSGQSSEMEITRIPGIGEARTIEFEQGWSITVNSYAAGEIIDGKMSLEEAAAVGRGELDIYAADSKWDDRNSRLYRHYYQYEDDDTGALLWRESPPGEPTKLDCGPGPEYRYEHIIRHYLDGHYTESINEINLDATAEEMEEGDYIRGEKYFGGRRWADTITAVGSEQDYEILGFELGDDDDLTLPTNSTVNMLYSITLGNSSILSGGTITSEHEIPIIVNGDDNEINTRIVDSTSDALVVNQGVRNVIDVDIEGPAGSGIVIRSDGGNRIENSSIQNCGVYGIWIDGAEQNEIIQSEIRDCEENGIALDNSNNNIIEGAVCKTNNRNGIHLSDSDSNQILYSDFDNNNWAGISVNDSQNTHIESNEFHGNQSGITLSGPGCEETVIKDCRIEASVEEEPEGGSPDVRRHVYGIWIRDEANSSLLDYCQINGTSDHGIVIEGPETHSNLIQNCRLGLGGEVIDRIGGDGIHIRNADTNQIIETRIMGCDGNGITISGTNSEANIVLECSIGRMHQDVELGDDAFLNRGWGIRIEDEAFATTVRYCIIGENLLGGISVQDTGPREGDSSHTFILEHNSIGYSRNVIPSLEEIYPPLAYHYALSRTSGSGISLDNAHAGHLFYNRIYGHETGISLLDTSENFIELQEVISSRKDGMSAERSRDELVRDSVFSRAEESGVRLQYSEDLQFVSGSVQSATEEGMIMRSCIGISLERMQIGPSNGLTGLAVFDSDDITVERCDSTENRGDGYLAENSQNLVFDRSHANENQLSGYVIRDCSGVKMFGERPREGFWVFNNQLSGIIVQDSEQVELGYDGKGVNVSGYTREGILIAGDRTDGVKITSSIVPNNGFIKGEYGIRVVSGSNITIGGPRPEERNNVELGNKIGILVTGENTDVSIINNLVGEPEEWETGTQMNGNVIGIKLDEGAKNVAITGNLINANQESGILLTGGANNNLIYGNQITENGEHGIVVQGPSTLQNFISRNSISRNWLKGIELIDGGNTEIEPPVITEANWSEYNIAGTCENVPEGSAVEVYADRDDEGLVLIGRSELFGNNFYVSGPMPENARLHGIVIDPDGNTSEFGPCELEERGEEVGSFIFASGPDERRDIFGSDPDLDVPTRITNNPADDYDPRFSEDGNQLLFVSTRSGNPDVWMMGQDNDDPVQVTDNASPDYDPDWPTEADRVAFVSERDGNPEIYVQSISNDPAATGGEISYMGEWFGAYQFSSAGNAFAVHMTCAPGMLKNISFYIADRPAEFHWKVLVFDEAPTDTVLAEGNATPTGIGWLTVDLGEVPVPSDFLVCLYFLDSDVFEPGVGVASAPAGVMYRWWTYNATRDSWYHEAYRPFMFKAFVEVAETGPARLTDNNAVDRYPRWSPDGSQIAFVSERGGNTDIWLMNADGSEPVQLTDGVGRNSSPAWSPEGDRIAFTSDRDSNAELYLLDLSTKDITRLTENEATDNSPVWDRNGTKILFSSERDSGFEIYSISLSGGTSRQLTFTLRDSVQPDAGPASLPDWLKPESSNPVTPQPGPPVTEPGPDLSIGSIHVKVGEPFVLDVYVSGAQGVGNLAFDLNFDPGALRLTGVSRDTLDDDVLSAINPDLYPSALDTIRSNWVRASGLTGDFQIISLMFQALEEAGNSEYPIRFENAVAYDTAYQPVSVTAHDGVVSTESDLEGVDLWMLY